MKLGWLFSPRLLIVTVLILALCLIVACGSGAEPGQPTTSDSAAPAETKEKVVEPIAEGWKPPTLVGGAPTTAPQQSEGTTAPAKAGAATSAPAAAEATKAPGAAAPTTAPAVTAVPETSIRTGGTILAHAYANPRQAMVHRSGSPLTRVTGAVFNNLIEFNPETDDPVDLRCELCTSWDIAEDGMTYTFNLVENAKWHDGVPLTADDIVFSFRAMKDPDSVPVLVGRNTSSAVLAWADLTESWRVIDPYTVEIVTKFPAPDFLPLIAVDTNSIIAKHTVLDQGIAQTSSEWQNFNGSGPFRMVDFTTDVGYKHEKNEEYWREGYPRVDGIQHIIILDAGTISAAYLTEKVYIQNGPSNNLKVNQIVQLEKDGGDVLRVQWKGPSSLYGMLINASVKPFDDPRVRKALYLAMHRQAYVDTFFDGRAWMGTPMPPGTWFGKTPEEVAQLPGFRELNGEKHPDDIEEARRLLTEAGLYPGGFDAVIMARIAVFYGEMAVLAQEQYKRFLNIDFDIRPVEAAAGFDAYDRGDYQVAMQGLGLSILSPTSALAWYSAGYGIPRNTRFDPHPNSRVQELIELQGQELDTDKRRAMVQEVDDILLQGDNTVVGAFWFNRGWVSNLRIQNFHPTASGQIQFGWEHLWCDPAC